jgi:hypothetical protein
LRDTALIIRDEGEESENRQALLHASLSPLWPYTPPSRGHLFDLTTGIFPVDEASSRILRAHREASSTLFSGMESGDKCLIAFTSLQNVPRFAFALARVVMGKESKEPALSAKAFGIESSEMLTRRPN